jgi:transcriptional regulator with GAF, ATPase, and Fis domain
MKTTKREEVAVSGGLPPIPALRLVYSGEKGCTVTPANILRIGETHIGRELPRGGPLQLPHDHRLSRDHAVVDLQTDGSLRIRDRQSTNGTFVNAHRVDEAPIVAGDLIRVGDSFLLVTTLAAQQQDGRVPTLIGTSSAVQQLRSAIVKVAQTGATVLLLGETGTGKEVTAQAIHQLSARGGQTIRILDCGAVSGSLVESELFGHEKGAFTGANQRHEGLFEAAAGSTLFIDELGELPLDLQPKLLRALEQRQIRRVGGTRAFPVDVRIIAATNRNLAQEVSAGRFRGDLYARLAEVIIQLPPMRERREDVLEILTHVLGEAPQLPPFLVQELLLHSWPYNVREIYKLGVQLQTFPTREYQEKLAAQLQAARAPTAAAASTSPPEIRVTLSPSTTPFKIAGPPSTSALTDLLRKHEGNVSAVARSLGVSRRSLHRWLRDRQLSGTSFRRGQGPSKKGGDS